MMRRLSLSVAAVAMVIGLLKLTSVPVAGQNPPAPAAKAEAPVKGGPALKTPWGEPDLQGIWTDEYVTPLQRPARYAGKELFTDAERAALDAARANALGREYRDLEKYPKGTVNDLQGAYNDFYRLRKHTGRRTSLIVDPPDGKMPAYAPEALKRQAAMREFELALLQASPACKNQEPSCAGGKYGPPSPRYLEAAPIYPTTGVNRTDGPEDHGLIVRCLAGYLAGTNGPTFSDGNYSDMRRIVQTPGGITMAYDQGQGQGWQRTVVMDGRPHLPSNVRQWWGDSRGHWEGNTLVIDVTNFTAKVNFFGARENLHLIERFTRTGPTTLEYVTTLDDPTTWVRPWTVKLELTKQDEAANRFYAEPRCHEGNFGLPGLIRGAREDDKAFTEGRGPNPAELCLTGCSFSDETADVFQ